MLLLGYSRILNVFLTHRIIINFLEELQQADEVARVGVDRGRVGGNEGGTEEEANGDHGQQLRQANIQFFKTMKYSAKLFKDQIRVDIYF
jgi:hypothetical protein